ncbi:syntaxin-7-like isoform X2 [Lineus longissimus]|uniref:syntaxin-7-like isoform X2 n=1 Tax=Lineus longissimus TaxID=88925 RepID=UPI002B4DA9B6
MSRGSFGAYTKEGSGGYNQGSGGYSPYQSGGPLTDRESNNEFSRLQQIVSSNIQKITQNVANVQRLVNQLGTAQDSEQLRDELHKIEHYTNQIAKDTSSNLQGMMKLSQVSSHQEQRQHKIQRERLTEEFTTALNNFQAALRHMAEKEKASVRRARAHSSLGQDSFLEQEKRDHQLIDIASSGGQSRTQQVLQMEEDVDLELLREREDAIKKLEGDIVGVNEIFKELGMMVHEQGEMIDSIEANVESAEINVTSGVQELSQARDYQVKSRKKLCIIITIALVIVAIIGIVIWLTNK